MTEIRNFKEARELLAGFVPPVGKWHHNYTLDLLVELMDKLGNPQDTYKVVHVAGTSGKTSTAYYCAALLIQTGEKVGLTVSPHVDEINERLQIDLVPLKEAEYCRELSIFMDLLKQTKLKPSYFELLVAFAYWEFARQKVEYVVIEVGMGGLLDGTNIITRSDKVSVITDIGLDHTAFLGNDLASIAAQKAGIILPNSVAFCYCQSDEVMDVFRRVAAEKKATLNEIYKSEYSDLLKNLPQFQKRNWYLALTAVQYVIERDKLHTLDESQLEITARTYIPGRMEVVTYMGKKLIFDGSHNKQKLLALSEAIKNKFPNAQIAVEIGLLEEKRSYLDEAISEIAKVSSFVIATSFTPSQDIRKKALDAQSMQDMFKEVGFNNIEAINDPVLAFEKLMARKEDILLVTGSFYLLNYVRPFVFPDRLSEGLNIK